MLNKTKLILLVFSVTTILAGFCSCLDRDDLLENINLVNSFLQNQINSKNEDKTNHNFINLPSNNQFLQNILGLYLE